jgi:AbrB family looped-hinge helix DNA binding protein
MSRSVKVLPKGQVTLPSRVRKKLDIHVGDTLILDEMDGGLVLKKGKTIFDFAGVLPDLGMTVSEMREKAVKESARERSKSNR